jgi:PAS domain S-box-containing protein
MEEEMRKLSSAIEQSIDGIAIADLEPKLTYVNDAFARMHGYSREEMIGMKVVDLHNERQMDEYQRGMNQIKTQGSWEGEIGHIRKDGTPFATYMSVSLLKGDDGKPEGMAVVATDITKPNPAEEAPGQPEELYRSMIELSPDGIAALDTKGIILAFSSAASRISGYSKDEIAGRHFSKIGVFRVKDTPKYLKMFSSCLRGKTPKPFEMTISRKDGTTFLAEVSVGLLKVGGKTIIQVRLRDITQRKQAEEALRKAHDELEMQVEERTAELTKANQELRIEITERQRAEEALRENQEALRKMFESVTDGISVIDLNGLITEVNQRTVEMHGFGSKDELLGKSAFKIVAPRDHERIATNVRQALKQGTIRGVEYTLLKADGSEFPGELSTSVLKDASGNPVGHITIARDITERKKIEDALMESKERFRIASQIASDVVYERDLQTGIATFYGDIESHLGYEPGGYPRTLEGWREHVHPEDLARIESQPMDQIQPGVPYGVEYRMRKKDGTYMTWSDRIMMVWDEKAGKPLKFIGAATDITERKQAEEALRAANKELREAQEQLVRSERLAAIGQLAGGVGHELRNPLGAIRNAAYYVKGKVAKSELAHKEPRVIEFLNVMDDEINTSNQIINDLLGFSRVGTPSVLPTQIKSAIEDALSPTTIPESIKLIKKLDAELPQIEIDASQIHQVLVNIITNAVQAMPDGGKLTIAARKKESFIEVEIADTGCGIPEEAAGKIFDPLFTTKAKGIGLGLAVCKTIIDRHAGKIEVKSQAGKGTTFTISLPLKRG